MPGGVLAKKSQLICTAGLHAHLQFFTPPKASRCFMLVLPVQLVIRCADRSLPNMAVLQGCIHTHTQAACVAPRHAYMHCKAASIGQDELNQ